MIADVGIHLIRDSERRQLELWESKLPMIRKFLRPTLLKIIFYITVTGLLWLILYVGDFWVFPCQTQSVIPNPPPFAADWCSLRDLPFGLPGLRVSLTPGTLLVLAFVFVIIPYATSCTGVWFVQHRKEKSQDQLD